MNGWRTNRPAAIDQRKRRELCQRLLDGDNYAQVELASLYHDAGYITLARGLLRQTRSAAQQHARTILEGTEP